MKIRDKGLLAIFEVTVVGFGNLLSLNFDCGKFLVVLHCNTRNVHCVGWMGKINLIHGCTWVHFRTLSASLILPQCIFYTIGWLGIFHLIVMREHYESSSVEIRANIRSLVLGDQRTQKYQ